MKQLYNLLAPLLAVVSAATGKFFGKGMRPKASPTPGQSLGLSGLMLQPARLLSLLVVLLTTVSAWSQIAIPYTENFSTITTAGGFPTVTGGAWTRSGTTTNQPTYIANQTTYNRSGNGDTKFMSFRYDSGTRYYFVGPFSLTAGTYYTPSVLYKADGLTGFGPLALTYGTTAAAATQTNVIASVPADITNSAYQTLSGNFTPATTGSYYLAVRCAANGNPWYLSIDDFAVNLTPTCVATSALTATNVTVNSATLSWTTPTAGTPANYQYEVRTSGAAGSGATGLVASGTTTAPTTTASVTGLSQGTAYSIYVRTFCGGSDYSSWASGTFTTQYLSAVTWTEGFATTTLPTGWTNVSTAWNLGSTRGVTGNPGNNIYKNLYSSAISGQFITLNVGALGANDRLTFDYKVSNFSSPYGAPGAGSGSFTIAVSTNYGSTWTDIATVNTGATAAWQSVAYPLASYSGQNVKFRITGTWVSGDYDLAFDNFVVEPTPSCVAPLAGSASAITTTGATVTWPAVTPTPGVGYEYVNSTTNTAPTGAGTATTATSVTLSGLTNSTQYYTWVRAVCSGSSSSAWTMVASYNTLTPGQIGTGTATTTALPINTCYGYNYSQQIYLASEITPILNPGETYITKIRFRYGSGAATPANFTNWTVYFGNTSQSVFSSATNWIPSSALTQVYSGNITFTVDTWVEIVLDSPFLWDGTSNLVVAVDENTPNFSCTATWRSYTASSNRGIVYYSDSTNPDPASPPAATAGPTSTLAQLQLTATTPPTCFVPGNIAISAITTSGARADWTAPTSGTTPAGYSWEVRTSGAPGSGVTGLVTRANETGTTVTFGSLSPLTTYTFYIRTDCGSATYSDWSAGYSFTTGQLAGDMPINDGFEGAINWSLINGTQTNKWTVGTAVANTGTHALYISNDSGTTNAYTTSAITVAHAYRDINVPTGTTLATLMFNYKTNGEEDYDYLRVRLVPTTVTPVAGTQLSGGTQLGGDISMLSTWQTYTNTALDLSAYAGSTVRLVFEWTNDDLFGTQPPAAIDNIQLLVPSCFVPTALASSAVTTTTATISWTAPTTSPGNGYDYYLSTTNTAPADTATPTATVTGTSASLSSLSSATTYYWWVRSNCGSGNGNSLWVSGGSFSTAQIPANLPLTENFEGTVNWTLANGTQTNQWYVGTAVSNGGTKSLYVSNTGGTTNNYDIDVESITQAYRDIVIPAGTATTSISFDWKANGEGATTFYDYFRVRIVPITTTPAPGTQVSGGTQIGGTFNLQTTWQTYSNPSLDLSAYAGQTVRLVFEWTNDDSVGAQPPVAIDNVSLTIPTCFVPSAPVSSAITTTGATIAWTAPTPAPGSGYDYYVSTSSTAPTGATTPTGNVATGTTTPLSGLASGTTYYWWVRSNCGSGDTSPWVGGTFTTVCAPVTTLPWTENFDSMTTLGSAVLPNCWTNNVPGTSNFTSANAASNTYNDPRSTPNYVTIYYPNNANSFLWTPGFNLTAGTTYTFGFYYAGDNTSGWVGQVYQNTTATSTGATQLGANFVDSGTTTTSAYTHVTRQFTPTTSGTYYFAVAANVLTTSPWYMGFDDFSVSVTPSDISGFNPTAACSAGGETITILGTNLNGATSVSFNGVAAASYSVTSNSTITAVTPAGLTTGPITVITPLNTAVSSTNLTINTNPTVAAITGASTLCTDTPVTLSSATAGGVWSSLNPGIATVDSASGLVTGLAAGTATIVYTVTTSGCSSSQSATVTVYEAPSISAVTSTQAITPGGTATYTVSASGSGLTYQWEVNTGSGWTALTDDSTYAGTATATLTVSNATLAMDGYLYHVIVTGTAPCTSVTSAPASTLYVSQVGITANPENVTNCSTTTTASFSVTATGTSITYQWQESTNGGGTWANIANGTASGVTYAGATSATLSLSGLTTANTGYEYRVIVTDVSSNTATSNEATLTIHQAVVIGTQPASQYACTGTAASKTFTVAYTGAGTIEWQYSANGTTWASVASATPAGVTYTGATTSSLTAATTASTPAGTYYYRAVITAEAPCSNVTTDVVTLTVGLPTVTASASAAVYCNPGTGVTLTAGGAATYSWSPATGLSAATGASVIATPTATTTYTVTGTDANGCTGTATVTVTVNNTPSATATAAASDVCADSTVQLDVNAASAFTTPAAASYQFTNTTGTYTNLSAGATAVATVLADDAVSAALPIGFTFNYAGSNYTQFVMSSNGFISFNTSATSTAGNNFSTAAAAIRPVIAPLWDDLDGRPTGATAYAGYEVTGSAPNRVLTIEWRNWEWNYTAGAAVISFQTKLYEGSNNIEFVYRSESGTLTSASASIGISAPTGTGNGSYLNLTSISAPAVSSTTNTTTLATKPATGTVYRFSPGNAPALTYSWTSSPAGFTSSVKNPVATVSENTTYTVTVSTAGGCSTTSNVTVNATSGGTITTQPTGSTLCQGGNFTLTVAATGPGLTYQWRKGGVNITSATSTSYTVTGATPADSADYDVVITPACGAPLTSNAATVLVNPTPTATAPANITICTGNAISAITLAGTPSGVVFDVTGGSAIGLSDLTGVTTIPSFTPSTYGNVTITVTPRANGCTGTAVTFTISVNPTPAAVSISASTSTVCNGSAATLTATGGTYVLVSPTGTGTTVNTTSGYPAPYTNYYGGTKHQMLIRASELTAMGYVAGSSITSIGFNVTAVGTSFTGSLQNFSINVGHTTATVLTTSSFVSGLTTVFPAATVTIPTTALPQVTTHTFTTPFVWDGTSNLVIQTSYSNANSGTTADAVMTTYSTTSYNSTNYYRADSVSAATILAASTPSGVFAQRPNITIRATNPGSYVWSPTTGLYTDAAATIAYTGGAASTVYAAPTASTTYTATVSTATCSASNTVTISTGSASAPSATDQTFCPGATVANLTATGTSIQWYTASTGGTALSSSTALISGSYYASQTVNGCESARTAIVITIQSSWTGAVDSSWTTAGNWCGNAVPTSSVDVIIPEVTNLPTLAAGQTGYARNLTLGANATLTVATGATLSVENVLSVHPDGELTVQDNGALIQGVATVNSANSGSINFTKNSSQLYRLDYTLWSSPVIGQNLAAFAPATATNRFYTYNPVTDQYATAAPATTAFDAATGYLIRMPNTDETAGYDAGTTAISVPGEFDGEPYNGTVTKTLSTAGNGYNAVGNPYPSPINIADFFSGNTGIINQSSGIYLWRKKNSGSSPSYATITLAAFTANTATGGGSENATYYQGTSENWLLAPAQGFIVKTAASTGSPVLSFTNQMRRPTPGSSQAFFRPALDTASRLWLNLTGNGAVSQTAVAYMNNATLDLDYGYDGTKFHENSNIIAFYSLAQNTPLAVQARPEFVNTDVVPMGFVAPTAGSYTITVDHVDGVFAQGQTIYLRDILTGMIANLSENSYTFVTEAGTFENRFEVLYNPQALGVDVPTVDANNIVVVKQGTTIQVNSGNVLMNGITIYDVRGRKVYSVSDINNTQTAITNLTAEQQVLIVEINTVKGKVSKRIVF